MHFMHVYYKCINMHIIEFYTQDLNGIEPQKVRKFNYRRVQSPNRCSAWVNLEATSVDAATVIIQLAVGNWKW